MTSLIILLFLSGFTGTQKDSLDLRYCYSRAYDQYPVVRKAEIQDRITRLNKRVAQTGYYPDIEFSAMASYQSDVTQVNFVPPGASAPTFSKDHYKVAVDITQPIYRGGIPGKQKRLEEAVGEQQKHSVEVSMHRIRSQVNEVYFSVLLLRQQAKSIELLMDQLRSQLRTIRSRVNSGVVLPSQQRILEVELLKASQDSLQTRHDITAAFGVLEELIGEEISSGKELAIPEIELPANPGRLPERPEYALFQSSIEVLKQRRALNEAQKVPKISAFGTTAYGRPGLDAFDDDLQAYYIVGVRLRWNFWDWRNADRQSQVLQHQKQMVEADESAFTRQLNGTLKQSLQSIHALEELIKRDGEIISLRERVVRESSSQLKNGTITATEYVTELTKANQARLTRFKHEVQLAKQKINYITILGLPWNEE